MKKITKIELQKPYRILCTFNHNEQRIIDLKEIFSADDPYAQKVLNKSAFKKVQIGDFGELYWKDVAEMKDLHGKTIPCNYDISPEWVYRKSKPFLLEEKVT